MSYTDDFKKISLLDLRKEVIDHLNWAYAHSHITVSELEIRLDLATGSESKPDLLNLITDLPERPAHSSEKTSEKSGEPEQQSWNENRGEIKSNQNFFAILGGTNHKGRWQPARKINAFSLLGGIDMDFREAEMVPGTTDISAASILGGIDIIVPPGINVEVSGFPILGGFDNTAGAGEPGAPTLKIQAFCLLGGLSVKRKSLKKGFFKKHF